jgi:hypothetical protein
VMSAMLTIKPSIAMERTVLKRLVMPCDNV